MKAPVEEWTALADGDERLENALVRLHILFRDADTLGSLIDPKRATRDHRPDRPAGVVRRRRLGRHRPLLEQALAARADDPATAVLGADAAGIARAADFLSAPTPSSPPTSRTSAGASRRDVLADYVEQRFSDAQARPRDGVRSSARDALAGARTALRVLHRTGCSSATLSKHSRRIATRAVDLVSIVARLGPGAFEADLRRGRQRRSAASRQRSARRRLDRRFDRSLTASGATPRRRRLLCAAPIVSTSQQAISSQNPGSSRSLVASLARMLAAWRVASAIQGIKTGDDAAFIAILLGAAAICGAAGIVLPAHRRDRHDPTAVASTSSAGRTARELSPHEPTGARIQGQRRLGTARVSSSVRWAISRRRSTRARSSTRTAQSSSRTTPR